MADDDPLAGKDDQLVGKGKEVVGDATGDRDLEAEGKGQKASGNLQEGVEDVKEKARDILGGDDR